MLCSSVPTAALHADLRVNSFAVQFQQLHSDLRVDSFAVQFRQLHSDLGVESMQFSSGSCTPTSGWIAADGRAVCIYHASFRPRCVIANCAVCRFLPNSGKQQGSEQTACLFLSLSPCGSYVWGVGGGGGSRQIAVAYLLHPPCSPSPLPPAPTPT